MKKNKIAFTLAEVMIVLTVIGILTAIMLPAAFHSTPNEDIMKFKKANSTLVSIVRELASNSKYYKEGDLRKNPNNDYVGVNYMCQTIADILSAKEVNCTDNSQNAVIYVKTISGGTNANDCTTTSKICDLAKAKTRLDDICDNVASPKGITTSDKTIWYEAAQGKFPDDSTATSTPECNDAVECNYAYKVLCLKVNTLYFGYGVRSDGKVITSKNVDDYISKSIQEQ